MKKSISILFALSAINLYAAKTVQNPQMNIDGHYSETKKQELSNEEIIEQARADAERENVVIVATKIRQQKLNTKQSKKIEKKELESLGSRMEDMFNE